MSISSDFFISSDKAGDCYIYSMLLPNENDGKLILGHLSMLLDVVSL